MKNMKRFYLLINYLTQVRDSDRDNNELYKLLDTYNVSLTNLNNSLLIMTEKEYNDLISDITNII